MAAALIIIIVISGFIFCHKDIKQKLKLHSYAGQYLYIHAARCGINIFIFAACIHFLIVEFLWIFYLWTGTDLGPNYFIYFSTFLSSAEIVTSKSALYYAVISILALTTVLLPSPIAYFFRRIYMWKYKIEETQLGLAISKLTTSNPFENLLLDAMIKGEHVMITLSSGKVYVGMIVDIGTPSETEAAFKDMHISPILSGYRDKHTQKVNFTTEYEKIDRAVKFSVLLQRNNIISVNTFDPQIYAEFNTQKTAFYKIQQKRT